MKRTLDDFVRGEFGNDFMDYFHDYPSVKGLWRYQHRCRIEVIDEFLSKYCSDKAVGLDAGSGKGPSTVVMSRYLNQIYSIEYEDENVVRQRENFLRYGVGDDHEILLSQGNLENITLDDEKVDVVVCSEVLEHIDNYERAAAEIFRVTRRGGTVIFSMPNALSAFWLYDRFIYWMVKLVRFLKRKPMDDTGYSFWERSRHWAFTSKEIRGIARKAGFTIVEERGISALVFNEWVYNKFMWGRWFHRIHRAEEKVGISFPRLCGIYFLVLKKTADSESCK